MTLKYVLKFVATIVVAAMGTAAGAQAALLHVRSTDGVRLAAWTAGTSHARAAVITIAGGPGYSHEYLGPLPDALSRNGMLSVTYDARGVGASTSPRDGRYVLSAYVEDLEALRRALEVKRIALVGHSFGGLVAAAYAVAHPDHLFALGLVDALPANRQTQLVGLVHRQQRITQLQNEGLIPSPIPPNRGNSCLPEEHAVNPAYLANPCERAPTWELSNTCSVSVLRATLSATLDPQVLATIARGLGSLALPALDVFGSEDLFGDAWDLESARLLTRARPRVDEIKGGGHIPWVEHPAQVFRALQAFVAGAARHRCGANGALCVPHLGWHRA
jgi:pimeloyl-ACP methyl ester carboxylesterase